MWESYAREVTLADTGEHYKEMYEKQSEELSGLRSKHSLMVESFERMVKQVAELSNTRDVRLNAERMERTKEYESFKKEKEKVQAELEERIKSLEEQRKENDAELAILRPFKSEVRSGSHPRIPCLMLIKGNYS